MLIQEIIYLEADVGKLSRLRFSAKTGDICTSETVIAYRVLSTFNNYILPMFALSYD